MSKGRLCRKEKIMNSINVKYKYKVGEVVFFMHDNQPRKGIISYIEIPLESRKGIENGSIAEKVVKGILSIIGDDKWYYNPRYTIDLLRFNDSYESTPHYRYEKYIFKTKKELLESL